MIYLAKSISAIQMWVVVVLEVDCNGLEHVSDLDYNLEAPVV